MQRYYSLGFEELLRWRAKVHALAEGDLIGHLEVHSPVEEGVEGYFEEVVAEACLEEEGYSSGWVGNLAVDIDPVDGGGYSEEGYFEGGIVQEEDSVVVESP